MLGWNENLQPHGPLLDQFDTYGIKSLSSPVRVARVFRLSCRIHPALFILALLPDSKTVNGSAYGATTCQCHWEVLSAVGNFCTGNKFYVSNAQSFMNANQRLIHPFISL